MYNSNVFVLNKSVFKVMCLCGEYDIK